MRRFVRLVGISSLIGLIGACGGKENDDMPVANSWSGTPQAGLSVDMASGMAANTDPHAGGNMGGMGGNMSGMGGSDPHAGLDMGGVPGSDPHAGLDMSGDDLGGFQAPYPNRAIDPAMFLKGRLSLSEKTASLVKPGATIFLSVRPINKATGESLGAPLAVERMEADQLPIDFHLSGAQTMVAGTAFEGDVMVYARVDGDGEASTSEAGDVEGSVMARIPQGSLELVLNTAVE